MTSIADYWRVIGAALKADAERRASHVSSHESDFLPAALAVVERPVSPTGRWTAWALIALLVLTVAWLTLGYVDVVVSAPGIFLPGGSSRLVQSAGSGVIAAIHVRDGDHVSRGQALVDLDTTVASAELLQAQKALLADRLEVERNRAIVSALDGHGLHFIAPENTPPEVASAQQRLAEAQVAEVAATVTGFAAARGSALADAQAAAAVRSKLDGTMPILDHELDAMNKLDANGYAPGLRLLELQRQRRSERGERDVAVAQMLRGASEARKYAAAEAQAREQTRRQALLELAKAQGDGVLKQEEVTKALRRAGLQHLISPTDGTVQQLQVHTIGGVVEPAQTLMVVVPSRGQIEVEARILSRDIGFVHEGQRAAVKVDAFPFTRFGSVPGTVVGLSRDAVPDKRLGQTYVARIRLDRNVIIADGKPVALTPGLSVTIDIRTGSRRLISWLLSPILTTAAQAGRER